MTQPTIKKYRRRVSDEVVQKIADDLEISPIDVRSVLEADAEVIEGELSTYALCGDGRVGIRIGDKEMGEYRQFHAEWEEIE